MRARRQAEEEAPLLTALPSRKGSQRPRAATLVVPEGEPTRAQISPGQAAWARAARQVTAARGEAKAAGSVEPVPAGPTQEIRAERPPRVGPTPAAQSPWRVLVPIKIPP